MLKKLQISVFSLLWLLVSACDNSDGREMATGSGSITADGSGDAVAGSGRDNPDDPADNPADNNGGGPSPDANLVVTYEEVVKPIIDNACVNCHNEANRAQAANLSLQTFNDLRTAYNATMLARINSEVNPMPPAAAQEVRADIAQLLMAWEAQGFQERIVGGGAAE
ncbi:MAG: hypothetical protein ACOH5I_21660 [Oligoflexus sp.]